MIKPINVELISSLFVYSKGILFNRTSRARRSKIGMQAGKIARSGYRVVGVNGESYQEHRLIYAICQGVDPSDKLIDHIDGNRLNNLIENLRLATRQENARNQKKAQSRNFSTGVLGVSMQKAESQFLNPYSARITINKKTIYLGKFPTKETASQAYKSARKQYFGEFA